MSKVVGFLILVLIVGLTIPQTREMMLDAARPYVDNVRARTVPRQLEDIANQLERYHQRYGRLPNETGTWISWLDNNGTFNPTDPWENHYFLEGRGGLFTVGSMGPDGEQGTEDDIVEQRRLRR
jgi:hypothetical protein